MLEAVSVILKALPWSHDHKKFRAKRRPQASPKGSISIERQLPPLSPLYSSQEYEAMHSFSHYSNWVIPGHLMVGRYPYIEPGLRYQCDTHEKGVAQLKTILSTGIRTFVCLQDELPDQRLMYGTPLDGFYPYVQTVESLAGQRVDALYFPIVDLSIPDADILNVFLTELEERLRNGERVYMHCWGGRGRAGLVAACLLSKAFKISAEESLERIGRAYMTRNDGGYRSPQTIEQVEFVKRFVSRYC